MKTQTQKMSQIFSAFSAWAGRGLQSARTSPLTAPEDVVQEYEAGVMPVLPQRSAPAFDEHSAH